MGKIYNLIAIDPGPEESGYVVLKAGIPQEFGIVKNEELIKLIHSWANVPFNRTLAIEKVACYGAPVGETVFDTCIWTGRFCAAWEYFGAPEPVLITRNEIKMLLCGRINKINDAVIRQRLIDLYGPGKEKAVGRKASPGPLYGIKGHVWSALAVATAVRFRFERESLCGESAGTSAAIC